MQKIVSAGVILGLSGFIQPSAFPCGNAVMLETDEAARLVADAEADLSEGHFQIALKRLYWGDLEVESPSLQKRISLVTATAQLRLGHTNDAAWAFDALHKSHPNDTVIETRLGETLANLRTKVAQEKAFEILESLEKRDLIADEHGFLALAKLRDAKGDIAGRDKALGRCRAVAKTEAFCALPAPKEKAKSKPTAIKAYGDGAPSS